MTRIKSPNKFELLGLSYFPNFDIPDVFLNFFVLFLRLFAVRASCYKLINKWMEGNS